MGERASTARDSARRKMRGVAMGAAPGSSDGTPDRDITPGRDEASGRGAADADDADEGGRHRDTPPLSDEEEEAATSDGGALAAEGEPSWSAEEEAPLDDEAVLLEVTSLYRGLGDLGASLWNALRERLRPPTRTVGRSPARRSRGMRALEAARSFGAVLDNVLDVNNVNPAAWVLGPVQVRRRGARSQWDGGPRMTPPQTLWPRACRWLIRDWL